MIPSLKPLRGKKVALDTMIFIYGFEEHSLFLPVIKSFFHEVEKGRITALTSSITLTECLVQPYRQKDLALAARYLVLFRSFPHLTVLPVTEDIAERAAWLRSQYQIKTPDAIQMATAFVSGAHVFLTNDEDLPKIKEIQVWVLKKFLS